MITSRDKHFYTAKQGESCLKCGKDFEPNEAVVRTRARVTNVESAPSLSNLSWCLDCRSDLDEMKQYSCDSCGRAVYRYQYGFFSLTRIFCSKKCMTDYHNAKRKERNAILRANTICQQCGDTFTPSRNDAKYCSPACRQKAYNIRKRA